MIGEITYSFQPDSWSKEEFLRHGGFTVVFLNYNKGFLIEKSVKSALEQDYPILEMFFMDDASSDGSGDKMEEIVQGYRGRHRVSVVRNTQNQYITGQWNIVSKIATGKWLGMFCGDDVAHTDRVTCVSDIIKQNPNLLACSTGAVEYDYYSGKLLEGNNSHTGVITADGSMSGVELCSRFRPYGATTFWHRSLFDRPLPKVPLDDDYLLFRAFAMRAGTPGEFFRSDLNLKTIDYTSGVGVCAQGAAKNTTGLSKTARWRHDIVVYKKFLCIAARTLKVALKIECEKRRQDEFVIAFKGLMLKDQLRATTTIGRFLLLPEIVCYISSRMVSLSSKSEMIKLYLHDLCLEFFGLNVGSYIRTIGLKMLGKGNRV